MNYAVVLYFDESTNNKIQSLINNTAANCGNEYMVKTDIPPHITISSITSDNKDLLIEGIDAFSDRLTKGEIFWASIGVFNPNVLFLSPIMNEYLLELCKFVNRQLLKVGEAGDNGFYLPYQWMPHTTIATKLSEAELSKAFETVKNEFKGFGGIADKIALAQCNPYKEIKIWKLSE